MNKETYPIVGMSPGNSYFSEDNIEYLFNTLTNEHNQIGVMIADIPAISTYIALGYPENRARTDKAIRNSNNIKNRITKVINKNKDLLGSIRVIDWATEVENNPSYQEKYSDIRNIYNSNSEFRSDCGKATQGVLESSGKEIPDLPAAIDTAVHYLLAELAFLEMAPVFFKKDHVTYVYHNDWPVYENYISGKYDGIDRLEYLGFLKIKNPDEIR